MIVREGGPERHGGRGQGGGADGEPHEEAEEPLSSAASSPLAGVMVEHEPLVDPIAALAAVVTIAGVSVLAVAFARLARAAHKAADLGGVETHWTSPAVAVGLFAISGMMRAVRALLGGRPTEFEVAVTFLAETTGALLVVRTFQAAHASRHGGPARGSVAGGLVYVGAAAASAFAVTTPGFPQWSQLMLGASLGALAWAFSDAALYGRATGGEPAWVRGFATVAAQVLVATAFARAILLNAVIAGGSAATMRLVGAGGVLLAAGLAMPCLTAAARDLATARARSRFPRVSELRPSGESSAKP